jgi:proline utilization trans-activator
VRRANPSNRGRLITIDTFLPWDLDSLFVSTLILLVGRFIDNSLMTNSAHSVEKAFSFFDIMVLSGNRIAKFRIRELRKLEEMLSEYSTIRLQAESATTVTRQYNPVYQQSEAALPFTSNGYGTSGYIPHTDPVSTALTGLGDEGSGFGEDLTAEQILGFAESVDIESSDWMSFATMEQYQAIGPQEMGSN